MKLSPRKKMPTAPANAITATPVIVRTNQNRWRGRVVGTFDGARPAGGGRADDPEDCDGDADGGKSGARDDDASGGTQGASSSSATSPD